MMSYSLDPGYHRNMPFSAPFPFNPKMYIDSAISFHSDKELAYVMYLQVTSTLNSLLSFVNALSAVQRYAPEAVLLMFKKSQAMVGPCCSASSILPSSSSLVKMIFGCGLPVALQYNAAFDLSGTVRSPLTLVSLTGTKILSNANTISQSFQHHVWH